ncbi:MAG: hypothetical protein EA367_04385 [Leptolyngbya sp. DLM2.Bin15]|nr:MAG: hypothetical protein EA367_04385 [Leptolyngbya sp. DLM2.Bin15]
MLCGEHVLWNRASLFPERSRREQELGFGFAQPAESLAGVGLRLRSASGVSGWGFGFGFGFAQPAECLECGWVLAFSLGETFYVGVACPQDKRLRSASGISGMLAIAPQVAQLHCL